MDDRVFYLVLGLFGMAASALIFGIMNSYATLKGIQANVTYKFTVPVVGVILTVLGGFLIPKGSSNQFLTVRVVNQDKKPVTRGQVTLQLFPITSGKRPLMKKVWWYSLKYPSDQLRSKIIINVVSDGYTSLTVDTLLANFDPINITVNAV